MGHRSAGSSRVDELGALLWVLLPDDAFFHRLGGGKPLGFGSVRLEVAGGALRDGRGWRDYYRRLTDPPEPEAFAALRVRAVSAFEEAVRVAHGHGGRFGDVPFIKAFLKAGHGFDDGVPVHYPRARPSGSHGAVAPNPKGESFDWFVENERKGRRLALPDLSADTGLPYHVKRDH